MLIGGLDDQVAAAGFRLIAGVDEAGRGACAGPLVAAAVILGESISGLDDSKRLTARRRELLFDEIRESALSWSVVEVAADQCDLGIQSANIEALRRAVLRLEPQPDYVLCDGFTIDGLAMPSLGVWKGDQISTSVAAASIVAKVTRDRLMLEFHERWPDYGFARHKGYGTAAHQRAIEQFGALPIHRLSFDNVQRALAIHGSSDRVGMP